MRSSKIGVFLKNNSRKSAPVAVGDSTPLTILEMVNVEVEGPAMTKVEKSNLEKWKKKTLMYFVRLLGS